MWPEAGWEGQGAVLGPLPQAQLSGQVPRHAPRFQWACQTQLTSCVPKQMSLPPALARL